MPHPVVDEYLEPVYSWIESSFGIEPAYVQLGIMLLGIVALWFVIPDIKRKTPEQMDPGSNSIYKQYMEGYRDMKKLGHWKAAEPMLRRALVALATGGPVPDQSPALVDGGDEPVPTPPPGDWEYSSEAAYVYNTLGECAVANGKRNQALDAYQQCCRLLRLQIEEGSPGSEAALGRTLSMYGDVCIKMEPRDRAAAFTAFNDALEILHKTLGPDAASNLSPLLGLAHCAAHRAASLEAGDEEPTDEEPDADAAWKTAEKLSGDARALAIKVYGKGDEALANKDRRYHDWLRNVAGLVYFTGGRLEMCKELLEETREMAKAIDDEEGVEATEDLLMTLEGAKNANKDDVSGIAGYTESLNSCAEMLRRKDYVRAEYFADALATEAGVAEGKDSPVYAAFMANLAAIHALSGDKKAALEEYSVAMNLQVDGSSGLAAYVRTACSWAVLASEMGPEESGVEEAIPVEVLDAVENKLNNVPLNMVVEDEVAMVLWAMAQIGQRLGKGEESAEHVLEVLKTREPDLSTGDARLFKLRVASILVQLQRVGDAERILDDLVAEASDAASKAVSRVKTLSDDSDSNPAEVASAKRVRSACLDLSKTLGRLRTGILDKTGLCLVRPEAYTARVNGKAGVRAFANARYSECVALWEYVIEVEEECKGPISGSLTDALYHMGVALSRVNGSSLVEAAQAAAAEAGARISRTWAKDWAELSPEEATKAARLQSRALQERSISMCRVIHEPDDPVMWTHLVALAHTAERVKEWELAIELYTEAAEGMMKAGSALDPSYVALISQLGMAYAAKNDYKRAERVLLSTVEVATRVHGKTSIQAASAMMSLAQVQGQRHEYESAESTAKAAADLAEAAAGPESRFYGRALITASEAHCNAAHYEDAAICAADAVDLFANEAKRETPLELGPGVTELTAEYNADPDLGTAWLARARVNQAKGDFPTAKADANRSIELLARAPASAAANLRAAKTYLAELNLWANMMDEATAIKAASETKKSK